MSIGFYFDDIEKEHFKCEHDECPYKACGWHRYSLEELERYSYACKYTGVASMFPMIFEDVEKCNMYLDI